ncbi:MAG TPA: nuclear transport factor 2 family protein [Flavisolibacter sp.]|nr:nuclear transport factor 2 family protein [Flavisolibacter sp.]
MRYFFALLLLGSLPANAQTEDDKIKAPIKALFDGMRKADTALMRSAFAPTAVLQTIVKNKEGQVSVKTEAVNEFIASIANVKAGALDERIKYDGIKVDADLASVWTPYQFYYNSALSHCGVNAFQLVRLNGEWKIQYIIDTRRRQGCDGQWKPTHIEDKK